MLTLGIVLSLLSGIANSGAAFLEKREMVASGVASRRGAHLLAFLVRRPLWLVAMALSLFAWVAETGALGLAPVAVVTTLRSIGRGGLIVAGREFLGERFGRLELVGIVLLIAGGVLTATCAGTGRTPPPLSDIDELVVAALAALIAAVLAHGRRGLALAAATGVLFIATGLFGKEIGDAVVRSGSTAFAALLESPGPWLMVITGVWGVALIQRALTGSNAATASTVTMTIASNGLIVVAASLYGTPFARRGETALLVIGIVMSAIGAIAVAVT